MEAGERKGKDLGGSKAISNDPSHIPDRRRVIVLNNIDNAFGVLPLSRLVALLQRNLLR